MRFTIAILVCVMVPSWSQAQVRLPANDATVSIGWAGSQYPFQDYDRWRGSLFLSVSSGHYWTEHLKTDIEAAWTSPVNGENYDAFAIAGLQTYAISNYQIRDVRLAIAQSYQFGSNEWVHPFVGVGTDIIRRETVLDRSPQSRPVYNAPSPIPNRPQTAPNVAIPARRESETRMAVRPFVKTGLKVYASQRAFFVTELKLAFAPDLDHALWKFGVGFDF